VVKPAAGYQSLACSSPEAVQTTGTVAIETIRKRRYGVISGNDRMPARRDTRLVANCCTVVIIDAVSGKNFDFGEPFERMEYRSDRFSLFDLTAVRLYKSGGRQRAIRKPPLSWDDSDEPAFQVSAERLEKWQ
jgi:hypothetical protein